MGFKGWVMSDWWAVHSTMAALHGVDQEMPGVGNFDLKKLQAVGADVHAMAERVLRGMLMAGAFTDPACDVDSDCSHLLYHQRVSTAQHARLAREIAGSAAVLLKNDQNVLPIKRGMRVALLGPACDAHHTMKPSSVSWDQGDYYVIGGSGRVISREATSLREALEKRNVSLTLVLESVATKAVEAARGADIAIVCGGGSSTEGTDRKSILLDQDHFIDQVLRLRSPADPPIVLAAFSPGALAMPWHARLTGAMTLFLSGQAHGEAWADALLGKVNPSGKLPVTYFVHEADATRPCGGDTCAYSEGLHFGWRKLQHKPVAFPFGHGLSYTNFTFGWAKVSSLPDVVQMAAAHANIGGVLEDGAEASLSFRIEVRNDGEVAGAEVVQLYLQYPTSAQEPLVLRNFAKTPLLEPGVTATVLLELWPRDFSIWSLSDKSWELVPGEFKVLMGSSSRDFRLEHSFEVQLL